MPAADILTRPGPAPDAVLHYREGEDGVIDVYLPPAAARTHPVPLIVALHGGFWRAAYDRRHLRPFAGALAARGFAVALPEFRRVGGGGEWPAIGEDVFAALRSIPTSVAAQGESRVDESAPCVVVGHSAGGHLALWAGLHAGPARVKGIVALAPVSDLVAAAGLRLSGGAVADLLGGEPGDRPEAYADADPLRHLPSSVPITVIQGADDADVPADLNRPLAHRPGVDYVELAGVEHLALIDPLSAAWRKTVLPAIAAM
jgi:dipeptidyl aminopeptidase/acylaminoacyl peptidase